MELTTVWFVLIAVLWTGYLVLEGFDFGVGMLLGILPRRGAPAKERERERRLMINTIGPVWDGNEVWLLTAGGATFAAFPEWYATLFSGFYLPLFLILVALIVRVVAFEWRGKIDDDRWRAWADRALIFGSWLPSVLWGVAFANIVRGVELDADHQYVGGFLALLNPFALLGGAVTTLLFLTHGAIFLALKSDGDIRRRAGGVAARLSVVTLVVAGAWAVWAQVAYSGKAWTWAAVALAAGALIMVVVATRARREGAAFVASAVAIVAAVVLIFGSLFPDVMPALDPANSLTVDNASSTDYTLTVMTWVAVVLTPLVLLYQGWTYWVFRKRLTVEHIPEATGLTFRAVAPVALGGARTDSTDSHDGRDPERTGRVRPLDPRLLRYARTARWYLALTVALGILTAGLVVAQALLLAHALGRAVDDGVALGTEAWGAVAPLVGWLALVVLLRAAATTLQERYAHRAAARATAELREAVVARSVQLGPRWLGDGRGPELVALATRGLDDLEPYFVRYLPQLVLAATVTPATLLVVLGLEWVSALILVVVLPLVPIFMWLVGRLTQGRSERGLATMQRLSSQVLDLLAGLPTLRALGRERGPAERVRALGDAHRRATMGTLRIAFLSGMVLELLSTLCVALVAVGIGLRLVEGDLDLVTGLAVLVLAPEVFAPLRAVGMQFHASTDGVAAAHAAFEVLDEPVPARSGTVPAPDLRRARVVVEHVGVDTAGGRTPDDLSFTLSPGRVTALAGPPGAGKSTTVDVLLGLLRPDEGRVTLVDGATTVTVTGRDDDRVRVDGQVDGQVELPTLWRQVTWVPQRPVVEPGSLAEVVGGDDDERARAARVTGLDTVLAALPHGWATRVGRGGHGLSVGQAQRVALTRALVRPAALVVLDEPTAHLDVAAESVVLRTVGALRASGRTVLLVAHRPALLAAADEVVVLPAPRVTAAAGMTAR